MFHRFEQIVVSQSLLEIAVESASVSSSSSIWHAKNQNALAVARADTGSAL